uniref:Uncharacterized protein n=1 Tax=Anguilla anguilla TaxID=7936 RepID=A0A0E9RGR2_ANGAN
MVYDNTEGVVTQQGSTVASQKEGAGFESQLEPFCVEFACSPPCLRGFLPGTPVSPHPQSKDMQIRNEW